VKTKLVFLTGTTGAPFDLASTGDPRSYADLTTPAGLTVLAETVNGIGPDKYHSSIPAEGSEPILALEGDKQPGGDAAHDHQGCDEPGVSPNPG
jgi:hypothetical protein